MRFVKASLPVCLLALLVVSCYSNTLDSPPVLDDFHTFVMAKMVHIHHFTIAHLFALSKTSFGWARWIPMVTFALDFLWGKGEIAYFHVTNIAIHLLCLLAVVFLVSQLVRASRWEEMEGRFVSVQFFALAVAGLWALNPVQTNAVTYLVQRMASLETLFYTLAVALYVLGRRMHRNSSPLPRQVFLCYAGCALSAVAAFLSKENSAMLPVMLLVTEWWFFTPDLPQKIWNHVKCSRRLVQLFYILLVLLGGLLFVHVFDVVIQGYQSRYFTLQERLLTESRIVVWYLSLLVLPLPFRLSLEHDVYLSTSLLSPPTTLLAIIFWLGVVFLIIRFRKRYPLMTYGAIWFFLNLLIESTVVPLELVFGHRLYCPSIGFFLFFVVAVLRIVRYCFAKLPPGELSKLCWSLVAIICSCLAVLTFERNMAWQTPITINADNAAKAPLNPRAHANLAVAYARAKKYRDAIREADLAMKLGRPHYESYCVAGDVLVGALAGLGENHQAISRGDAILKNRPPDCDATGLPALYLNLAQAHLRLQQIKDASHSVLLGLEYASRMQGNSHGLMQIEAMLFRIFEIAKAQGVDLDAPGRANTDTLLARNWVAKQFVAVGRIKMAQELLAQVLQKHPHQRMAVSMLDSIKRQENLNRIQRTKTNFTEKYVYHPFSRFNLCMATAFLIEKYQLPTPLMDLGENLLQYAIRLRPQDSDAHLLMGWYCFRQNRIKEALRCARYALKLDPDNAKSWLGLALFLVKAGQPQAAIDAFHKTLALYPGYRHRPVLLGLITNLEKNVHEKIPMRSGVRHS